MKKILTLLGVILTPVLAWSQQTFEVSGRVLDTQREGLPFATVKALQIQDSVWVRGEVTQVDGTYQVVLPAAGTYRLSFSMIGFQTLLSQPFAVSVAQPKIQLPDMTLAAQENILQAVTVRAQKPFIEQTMDKTILNVADSPLAGGSTALEILERAPGVVIDHQNDRIQLKNKTGVMIMIDGKRSFMSEADLALYLRNMPSDQIASIEILTNPSAKYEASGNSGIIHIKLKKNQSIGTNGTFSASLGDAFIPNSTPDLYRGNSQLMLNHRKEKWNVYGTAGVNRSTWYNDNTLVRRVNFENQTTIFDQFSQRNGQGEGTTLRLGTDYFVSPKTTLGILYDGNFWQGGMKGDNKTDIRQSDQVGGLNQLSQVTMARQTQSGNFNVRHVFDDKGKELTFDVDYSHFRNRNEQNFETDFFGFSARPTLNQRNITPTDIGILAAKMDITLPVNEKMKWETGWKTAWVQTDNNFRFEQQLDQIWQNDPTKTNHFQYQEWVNAGYANLSYQGKKVGIQAGLRAEHTQSNGYSITLDERLKRNYLSLFPSMFIQHKISDIHSVRYSYSRRIDRPNYGQLNPFIFYLDPFTYEEGNPNLQPQFTDNLEMTYVFKDKLTVGLGYSRTHDFMAQITEQDDATQVTRAIQRNLALFENFSINASLPTQVMKGWMMQNQGNVFYNKFSDGNLLGGTLSNGQWAYSLNSSHTVTLPKRWSGEVTFWYNSPNVYGIFRNTKPQYALNAGIQRTFWEKKGRIKLNVTDIFLTSFWVGRVNYQNMDFTMGNRWTSRRATLSFTYQLGNQQVKGARRRGTAVDTERQRIDGGQS